jgi:alcohol dehydrogenase, propanol-preferring
LPSAVPASVSPSEMTGAPVHIAHMSARASLRAVRKGGAVVCAGIHMSDIPSFPYADLWGERSIRSVANLTRRDGEQFLALAPQVPVHTHVVPYALERAGEALEDLRSGRLHGAAVVRVADAAV